MVWCGSGMGLEMNRHTQTHSRFTPDNRFDQDLHRGLVTRVNQNIQELAGPWATYNAGRIAGAAAALQDPWVAAMQASWPHHPGHPLHPDFQAVRFGGAAGQPCASGDFRMRQQAQQLGHPSQSNQGQPAQPVQLQGEGAPYYFGSSAPPGYKIRVGDLALCCEEGDVWNAIWASLERGNLDWRERQRIWECVAKVDVKNGRASSGASYATITVVNLNDGFTIYKNCWDWVGNRHIPSAVGPRTLAVKWLQPEGAPSSSSLASATPGNRATPKEHGAVQDLRNLQQDQQAQPGQQPDPAKAGQPGQPEPGRSSRFHPDNIAARAATFAPFRPDAPPPMPGNLVSPAGAPPASPEAVQPPAEAVPIAAQPAQPEPAQPKQPPPQAKRMPRSARAFLDESDDDLREEQPGQAGHPQPIGLRPAPPPVPQEQPAQPAQPSQTPPPGPVEQLE